jgi:uncharacterized membrane-anchored protein YitT (DUF2179 family)
MKTKIAKAKHQAKHPVLMELYRYLSIIIGGVLVALGLEAFLIPNGFIDGGVTGISIILSTFIPIPVGIFIAILNVPFVIVAWAKLGSRAALKTAVGVASLATSAILLHHMDPWTDNFILALGYGGLLLGLGIGLALRQGGALDGTESLASIISSNSRFSIDQLILAVNVLIFTVAGLLLEPQQAMASALLFYVVVTPIIKKVVDGGSTMKQVRIITENREDIALAISAVTHRRVTVANRRVYDEGSFDEEISEITFAVSRLEEAQVTEAVREVDPDAIISFIEISTLRGGVYESDSAHGATKAPQS